MNKAHNQKLSELHQLRQRANEEIKACTLEASKQRAEINTLLLETKKYESQLDFLSTERDIILKAQM